MLGDGHDSYCLLYNCMFILGLDEHALEEKLGDHQFYYSLAWQARNCGTKERFSKLPKSWGYIHFTRQLLFAQIHTFG